MLRTDHFSHYQWGCSLCICRAGLCYVCTVLCLLCCWWRESRCSSIDPTPSAVESISCRDTTQSGPIGGDIASGFLVLGVDRVEFLKVAPGRTFRASPALSPLHSSTPLCSPASCNLSLISCTRSADKNPGPLSTPLHPHRYCHPWHCLALTAILTIEWLSGFFLPLTTVDHKVQIMAVARLADFGRSTSLPQAQGSLLSAPKSSLDQEAAPLRAAPDARAHSTPLMDSQYSERSGPQMEPLSYKPDTGPSPSNHELQPRDICNLQELGTTTATTRSVQDVALGSTSATTRSVAESVGDELAQLASGPRMRDSEVARNLQADFAQTHNAQVAGKKPVPAPPPLQMRDSEVARNLQTELDAEAAAATQIPETVKCRFEPLMSLLSGGVSQWSEAVDPKGRTYYWNKTTKEASWTPPPGWNNSVQTHVCDKAHK